MSKRERTPAQLEAEARYREKRLRDRTSVTLYLTAAELRKLDKMRGRTPRATYVKRKLFDGE